MTSGDRIDPARMRNDADGGLHYYCCAKCSSPRCNAPGERLWLPAGVMSDKNERARHHVARRLTHEALWRGRQADLDRIAEIEER